MATEFFTEDENMADLISHMDPDEAHRYGKMGHLSLEPAFINRIFIVYKATGLTKEKAHRDPDILHILRVTDFILDPRDGCYVVLRDDATGEEQTFGYVPKRVFGKLVFVSIPPKMFLKWDAHWSGDVVQRSLAFVLLVKRKNKSSFYSGGNIYFESPNVFRELYPNVSGVPGNE